MDVRMVLRKGATVRGVVKLADGTPSWGSLRIEGSWGMRRTWMAEKGEFEIRGIPPGPCVIVARQDFEIAPKLTSGRVHIHAGGPPVELVLRKPKR